ncbi:MAG: hypothetical protein U1F43_20755 [Myxococcota bacterium]
MFAQWAAVEAAQPAPLAPDDRLAILRRLRRGLDIRIAVTVTLVLMAAIVMWKTRHGVAYWLHSSDPVELGDLRKRWVAGDRVLPGEAELHDSWVHVSGLVPTRLIGVADPDDATGASLEYVFFCPLFDLTVLSKHKVEIPAAGMNEFDPTLKDVVLQGLADPADTMARWEGNGRLLRGDAAPPELRAFVESYARRMGKPPELTWVLVEGKSPGSYAPSIILWGLALVPIIVSIVFLLRARRAWEQAVLTGPPA